MNRFHHAGIIALMSVCFWPGMAAAEYPERPVTMIVPFAPGGATDVVARTIQEKLSEELGQNVVVENRAGAGGNIGVDAVVRSEPDGYTILLGNVGTITINKHIYPDVSFDPLTDLDPVTEIASVPAVLVVNPSLPVESVDDLVTYIKERDGEVAFASAGSASLTRLQMELFRLEAGVEMIHVPHSGGAGQAITAIVGNHVPVGFSSLPSAIGQIREGQLKALGITSKERLDILPDVPTMSEAGFPENASSAWNGIFVPAGTPDEVVQTLFTAIIDTVKDPDVAKRLENLSAYVEMSESPEDFGAFIKAESARWQDVIEKTGASAAE